MSDATERLSTQARKEALASGLVERWRGIRYHGNTLGFLLLPVEEALRKVC